MMRYFIFCLSVFIACSCKQNNSNHATTGAEKTIPINNTQARDNYGSQVAGQRSWSDDSILNYINQNWQYFTNLKENDSTQEEWTLDRTESTDSAKYLVYQIGHSFEHKFITDKWLYIDSSKRIIYEYDLPNDQLIKWNR